MQLKAVPRESKQKLAEGFIPAVAYNKDKHLSLALELRAFDRVFRSQSTHGIVEIAVEGGETLPALVKSVQMDKRRRTVIHADFFLVKRGEAIEVPVPVHTEGRAPGEVQGGMVDIVVHNLNIVAPGFNRIPEQILVDVSALEIGDHVTAGDLKLPQGVTLAVPEDTLVITVLPPRITAEEEAAEQEAAQLAGLVAAGEISETQAEAIQAGEASLEEVKEEVRSEDAAAASEGESGSDESAGERTEE